VAQATDSVLAGAKAMSSLDETQLRQAFLSLVPVNDEGRFTRRPFNWADLPQPIHSLLERFVQARLLVSRQEDGARVLEVAHEALFRAWARLAAWLDQDRAFLLWRKRLDQALDFWLDGGKTREPLLTGTLRESEARLKTDPWCQRATQTVGVARVRQIADGKQEASMPMIDGSVACHPRRKTTNRVLSETPS
jgi:hypothetical protein